MSFLLYLAELCNCKLWQTVMDLNQRLPGSKPGAFGQLGERPTTGGRCRIRTCEALADRCLANSCDRPTLPIFQISPVTGSGSPQFLRTVSTLRP